MRPKEMIKEILAECKSEDDFLLMVMSEESYCVYTINDELELPEHGHTFALYPHTERNVEETDKLLGIPGREIHRRLRDGDVDITA